MKKALLISLLLAACTAKPKDTALKATDTTAIAQHTDTSKTKTFKKPMFTTVSVNFNYKIGIN